MSKEGKHYKSNICLGEPQHTHIKLLKKLSFAIFSFLSTTRQFLSKIYNKKVLHPMDAMISCCYSAETGDRVSPQSALHGDL